MKFNNHQKRLWKSMIEMIDSYMIGDTDDFFGVIGNLEGALDASEVSDGSLITKWYDYWTPLEIYRAVNGNNIERSVVLKDLEKMKAFLEEVLKSDEYI